MLDVGQLSRVLNRNCCLARCVFATSRGRDKGLDCGNQGKSARGLHAFGLDRCRRTERGPFCLVSGGVKQRYGVKEVGELAVFANPPLEEQAKRAKRRSFMATTSKTSEYGGVAEFPKQSGAEELANTVTHGMGMVLSVTGTGVLLGFAWRQGMSPAQLFATLLYCLSLIAVYAASTFSHALQEPHRKHLFRVLDQAVIYCLIAGTYTPFIFLYLPSRQSWLVFAMVWSLALVGFISKVLLKHRIDAVAVANYVLLGWVPAATMFYLLPFDCLMWMLVGGCFYTAGAFFLTFDQRVPFFHTAWHTFVLLASAVHFYGVLHYTVV